MDVNNLKVERRRGGTTWINGLLLGFLGVLIISIVVLSSVPPVSKDALSGAAMRTYVLTPKSTAGSIIAAPVTRNLREAHPEFISVSSISKRPS